MASVASVRAKLALPALWLFAAVVSLAMSDVLSRTAAPASGSDIGDAYYLMVHIHYALSLSVGLAFWALPYAVLEFIPRQRYRRGLGLFHLGLTGLGVILITLPPFMLHSVSTPHRLADAPALFSRLNGMSMVGYGFTSLGLLVFAVLLLDLILRSIASRRPSAPHRIAR